MILFFSGTGNSEYVAKRLAGILGDRTVPIVSLKNYEFDEQRIVWVFPTYSWGVPPIVKSVISKTVTNSDCRHFMVTTCGDDIGNCHIMWRKLMESRNMTAVSAFSVIMPNTYVFMKGFNVDPYNVVKKKLSGVNTRVDDIANAISKDNAPHDDVNRGCFAWIKTNIIYPYFVRFCMKPEKFTVSENCNGCGLCAKKCPLSNISMNDDKPVWGSHCAFCSRCYHQCPRHAIDYDKTARFKGQYLFSRLSNLVK